MFTGRAYILPDSPTGTPGEFIHKVQEFQWSRRPAFHSLLVTVNWGRGGETWRGHWLGRERGSKASGYAPRGTHGRAHFPRVEWTLRRWLGLSHLLCTSLKEDSPIYSVQFSHSVMSNSLQPQESQHARPPCPSPTPGVHSNSYPSSQRCHPAISSSVFPFSSCPQCLPASESFPKSQLFAWGQSTGVSALASFLPKNTQDWSSLEWTGWISLQSKGLLGVFSNTTVQKHQFYGAQLSSQSNSHIHTRPLEKP